MMKQISIEIIHKCPNHCLHCSSFSGIDKTLKISTDEVKKVIDSAYLLKTEVISISGGEPFLHEGLTEAVCYAKEKGIRIYIYTSGVVLNSEGAAASIELEKLYDLRDAGADKLIFDLPAVDEDVYDEFMGTHGYQKFALESIDRSKQAGIFTEIHFVPTKININQIDKILSFVKTKHIDKISFLGLIPHGRARNNRGKIYLSQQENEMLKRKLHNLENDKVRVGIPLQYMDNEYQCYAGKSKLCIRYDGKVFGCEAFKYVTLTDDNGNKIEPDSIYSKDLYEIFNHSEYLISERRLVQKTMGNCECSEKCPVQKLMRKAI